MKKPPYRIRVEISEANDVSGLKCGVCQRPVVGLTRVPVSFDDYPDDVKNMQCWYTSSHGPCAAFEKVPCECGATVEVIQYATECVLDYNKGPWQRRFQAVACVEHKETTNAR